MMGDCCQKQCEEFYESASYEKAVKNLEQDCNYANGGNIPKKIVDLMEKCCGNGEKLHDIVKKHGILKKPDDYKHLVYEDNTDLELRRIVPLSVFIRHHISYTPKDEGSPKEYDQKALEELVKNYIIDKCSEEQKLEDWEHQDEKYQDKEFEVLNGSTYKLEDVSWWTFYLSNTHVPVNGENYVHELALPDATVANIELEGSFIEIVLTRSQLNVDLSKPTAIEGFYEDSRFYPETSGLPYGMTKPLDSSLEGRPELISKSVNYQDSGIKKIKIRYWSYK